MEVVSVFFCLFAYFVFSGGGGGYFMFLCFSPMHGRKTKPHRSAASAVYSLLQHCLRWFTTREEANTRGRGGRREKSNPSNTNYQKEKI